MVVELVVNDFMLTCDTCNSRDSGFETPEEALEYLREHHWIIKNNNRECITICPRCSKKN